MYSTNELDIQFEMLKKCANHMLLSIGGLWASDEVLFHMTPDGKSIHEEQESFIKFLFE